MTSSLSSKLVRTGTALLVVALASIGLTLWVTWQLEGGAAAVNETGRLRMQTWRLANELQSPDRRHGVQTLVTQMDASLALLKSGDRSRPLLMPKDPEVLTAFSNVESLWDSQKQRWSAAGVGSNDAIRSDAAAFVVAVDRLVSAIEAELSGLTATLNLFQFVMMALAISGAVIMLYTGNLYVISPLTRVQQALKRVEKGDFATRIDVDTRDEFGEVAAGFNRMTHTLRSLYAGLEAQVKEKTSDIEAQRIRLETLYSVSAFLAQGNSIHELSQGFAQRVRSFMKADAAAVRWSDEASHRYLMLATDGWPADLVDEERSVIAGACACGQSSNNPSIRVIPIASLGAPAERACARAGYRTVVTVPIHLQQRTLGELDLFYRAEVALSVEERDLLDTLGAHLASSLESLRAAALEREAAAAEERSFLARELHDSIAQSLSFLKIQAQLLRDAVGKNDTHRIGLIFQELDSGLKESIADVRELLVHFRTRTQSDDVETALRETVHKFQHQTGLPVSLQVEGDGLPLPPDVQVHVLHIVQEALSNVRKHAQAAEVRLLVKKGRRWVIRIEDDGVGFERQRPMSTAHVGLNIMKERADRIDAQVHITSAPKRGTVVELILPDGMREERVAPHANRRISKTKLTP